LSGVGQAGPGTKRRGRGSGRAIDVLVSRDASGGVGADSCGYGERLQARRSEIEEAIFARVHDGVFDPAGRDAEYVAGLRTTVAAVVGYGLTGIARGEASSVVIPSAAVVQARLAARAGVGLDTVLRRYVAGHAVLEDFVVQEADRSEQDWIPPAPMAAVRQVLETSASMLDRLIPSIIGAYTQELERIESSHSHAQRAGAPARAGQPRQGVEEDGSLASSAQEQRGRIKQALVEVLAERGFAGATVGLVVGRAGVSTRTFYQCFDGLEECLIAVMDSVMEQIVALSSRELEAAGRWQEGIRSALAAVLSYLDRQPEPARVCLVETLAGGPVVLAHRERLIEAFRLPVIERIEREVPGVPSLAAEGVLSSVFGILHAHIVTEKPGPFIELLGPLMGLIMAPYLGALGMGREIEQGDALARAILNGDSRWSPPAAASRQGTEHDAAPAAALFPTVGSATARHLRECLLFLAEHPDSSNREVGLGIDLVHQSQVSKLLAHLLREGLATKRSEGQGKRNAWRLTPSGEQIARALSRQERQQESPSSHSPNAVFG
jgi:AcrR family transcriptional regulator